eukprot:4049382-Pleurochrysis_carterae.AAC.1
MPRTPNEQLRAVLASDSVRMPRAWQGWAIGGVLVKAFTISVAVRARSGQLHAGFRPHYISLAVLLRNEDGRVRHAQKAADLAGRPRGYPRSSRASAPRLACDTYGLKNKCRERHQKNRRTSLVMGPNH